MKLSTILGGLAAAVFCLALLSSMPRAEEAAHSKPAAAGAKAASTAYPLDICIVTGEKLGEGAVSYSHEGREIRFCCSGCIETFKSAPAEWLAKLDSAIIEEQKAAYPLDTCPITGEGLESMGGAYDIVVDNRLVRLCCKGCEKAVRADAAKYIKMLDEAVIEKQMAAYPAKVCPVAGDELGPLAVNMVYDGKLVRLCCEHCVEGFLAEPAKYIEMIYGK
ncbi:hypothetical protein IT575_05990 [bacterium]|nr:hypothetical protein [bacterium]